MSKFHQNIELLRKEKRLSQTQMGKYLGLSQTSYGRYEKTSFPSYDMLIQLSDFFQVTIDDLLKIDMVKEGIPQKKGSGSSLDPDRVILASIIGEKEFEIRELEQQIDALLEAELEQIRILEDIIPQELWKPWKEKIISIRKNKK